MTDKTAPAPNPPRVILATPRLVLRTTTEADIPVLHARIFGDADVMRYVFGGGPMPAEQSEAFIRKYFTFGPGLTEIAVLTEKPVCDIVGFAGLFSCDALGADDLEIGFVLARDAWGRGLATEIGEAQLAFGFENLQRERLLGLVDSHNAPSIHALEKLGLRYLKDVVRPPRASRAVYIIEAGEWRNRRGQRA